jgi:hypothetical protein
MSVKRAKDEGQKEEDMGYGSPTFCGKWSHPLLWAGSHDACGILKCPKEYKILILYTYLYMWPRAAYYILVGPGVKIHVLEGTDNENQLSAPLYIYIIHIKLNKKQRLYFKRQMVGNILLTNLF